MHVYWRDAEERMLLDTPFACVSSLIYVCESVSEKCRFFCAALIRLENGNFN